VKIRPVFSFFVAMVVCAFTLNVYSQKETLQPLKLVDCHTAGMLSRGYYAFGCQTYPNGNQSVSGSGVTLSFLAALTDRINIGIGYGGDGFIGREMPRFNPHIGAIFKFRIIEESYFMPAFAIGYDHQGSGGIDIDYNGYVYKSPGFFLAMSKNYLFLTALQVGLHGGLNYSFEENETIKWPNVYGGIDVGFNEKCTVALEYDCALNAKDAGSDSLHSTYANPLKGYLNFGVRWFVTTAFCIELDVKDMLQNKILLSGERIGWGRELKLTYIGKMF